MSRPSSWGLKRQVWNGRGSTKTQMPHDQRIVSDCTGPNTRIGARGRLGGEAGQPLSPIVVSASWASAGASSSVAIDRFLLFEMLGYNYATHKHPAVKAWLATHPRVTLHFTPTGCSWLNMVEIFFGIISRQAIRRGMFRSVKELIAKIGQFVDGWNDHCQPFSWTKDAEEILDRIKRKETIRSRH